MDLEPFFAVKGFRRVLVILGLSAIIVALLLFAGTGVGLLPNGLFSVLGQSDLRSIAGLAVAGCLLVAIGYGHN
jgi:hypothetical protein